MKYTQEELFAFMDARRPIKVTCTDGKTFVGMCWAYSSGHNLEEEGIDEPSIEVRETLLYLHEIEIIEYAD
jgi:hypothetical protein